MQKPIAIIGAGNGGQAFAGYLSLHGRTVKIFDVVQSTVDRLTELGGVTLEGHSDVTGFGKIVSAKLWKDAKSFWWYCLLFTIKIWRRKWHLI